MSRINCEHCDALVMPGATFCLKCFLPFDDEPAPAAATVTAAPAYQAGPAPYQPPAAPPSPPAYGAPWPPATHATAAPLTMRPSRRGPSRRLLATVVAGVLVLGGLGVAAKRTLLAPKGDKHVIATAFREARAPEHVPMFPEEDTLKKYEYAPDRPGAAKSFVTELDPAISAGNDGLRAMQRILARWADGDVDDASVVRAAKDLKPILTDVVVEDATEIMGAPPSTIRARITLSNAATRYVDALHHLEVWIGSGTADSLDSFRLNAAGANADWDDAVTKLYTAAGLDVPELPHPKP